MPRKKEEPNQLTFTVYGTQEGLDSNPIGYVRTTHYGKWVSKQFQRYWQYQHHIARAFAKKYPAIAADPSPVNRHGRPILLEGRAKVRCDIRIFFKNHHHSDPDNIVKAFSDSLFSSDKYICGSYDFDYDKQAPRVEVTITL